MRVKRIRLVLRKSSINSRHRFFIFLFDHLTPTKLDLQQKSERSVKRQAAIGLLVNSAAYC